MSRPAASRGWICVDLDGRRVKDALLRDVRQYLPLSFVFSVLKRTERRRRMRRHNLCF